MKMNSFKGLLLLLLSVFVVGCSKESNFDLSKYDTKNYKYKTCNRKVEEYDDVSFNIAMKVYYNKEGYIEILHTKEKVTSKDIETLDQYEKSYKNVYLVYSEIDYYDNVVTRSKNSVISETYINYGKVDIDKIMEIEGSEDNVEVTNGKIKLSDWEEFAKKYGTVCK